MREVGRKVGWRGNNNKNNECELLDDEIILRTCDTAASYRQQLHLFREDSKPSCRCLSDDCAVR